MNPSELRKAVGKPDLVIGTTNQAKFRQLRAALGPSGLAIASLADLEISGAVEIPERGESAQENARIKATTYARALGASVLSVDTGLYLSGLPDERQPGIFVRRIYGPGDYRPSDQELLAHYCRLIAGLGGKVDGRWEFAACIATPAGRVFEDTFISHRHFVSDPCDTIVPGYPLESLQIDPDSGRYIAEMTGAEKEAFWRRLLGDWLVRFVRDALADL
jgi:8-oxo-dGTP diphosphatase